MNVNSVTKNINNETRNRIVYFRQITKKKKNQEKKTTKQKYKEYYSYFLFFFMHHILINKKKVSVVQAIFTKLLLSLSIKLNQTTKQF